MKPKIREKRWSKELERLIYTNWKKAKIYTFDPETKKPIYSIDTPPPYVNTPIHIGHATTYTIMDMIARFHRMTGFEVLFPLGLDRNGLPIEMEAEKRFNASVINTPREQFIELCKKVLEESSSISEESFLRLGISFNSWNRGKQIGDIYFTDSKEYRTLTQSTFIDMWNADMIYEDSRINNFCIGCRTTIADAEIEYKDMQTLFNDIIFTVKETGEKIVIGTTRPELIASCAMIIFNPEDERYKKLEGKTAITPIYNKEIPIRAHTMADPTKGTGLVMMCSFGDQADIRFFREMNIEPIITINYDGTMNEKAGFLAGMKTEDARNIIIEKLTQENLVVDQHVAIHRTPVCERSKHMIEFLAMPEFYMKQIEHKDKLREIAKKVQFFSPHSRQILLDWINSVTIDWPISRRRFYATEIPLWYCKKCRKTIIPKKGRYYQPWKEPPPVKACSCGSKDFTGETRVFDTWFDSSISPLIIMKYTTPFFDANKPCSLRPQGKEIVRTWLYYTLLRCYLLTKESIFRDIWIHYHVVDDKGKKMSKSVGNIIKPQEILDKYGAEPFRLWCAVEGNITDGDIRCSFERIEGAGKTLTKLWNVARFVSMFPCPRKIKLTYLDKWIINEMQMLIELTRKGYKNYDFHNPVTTIKHFIWEIFASHYIELVKNRAYNQDKKFTKNQQKSALYTLHYCLDNILKMLAPVIPMITYKLYNDMRKKDIHKQPFPQAEKKTRLKFRTKDIESLNSFIWKSKKDKGLSLKSGISELKVQNKYKPIEKDIMAAHNVKKITYAKKVDVVL